MGQPMGGYQQPMMGQPMGGYQQPMMGQPMMGGGMGGFVNSLKADTMKLIGFIGAILITIAPFFSWFSYKIKEDGNKESDSLSMFGVGGDGDIGIFTFLAILLLISGVVLILWDLADFIPALRNVKASMMSIPYIELILVGVALIAVVIAMLNGDLNDYIDLFDGIIESAEKMGKYYDYKVSGSCNHGLGPIVAILGILGAAAPRVKKMMGK